MRLPLSLANRCSRPAAGATLIPAPRFFASRFWSLVHGTGGPEVNTIAAATVKRDWLLAKTWLRRELEGGAGTPDPVA